jgi:isopentenyl phosphate kinase
MPMTHAETVFIKLGGSLITDKTREATVRLDVIERLAREIRAALDGCSGLHLVLGHGSGSFGHFAARRYGVHRGVKGPQGWAGLAQTSAAAARLNRLVTDACLDAGVLVIAFQPSASALCRGGVLAQMAAHPVEEALSHGLVPLVYGDVAFDAEQGTAIISTEDIFSYLAESIVPSRILMVGVVDGVYEEDPLRNPRSRCIPLITPDIFDETKRGLGGSHGTDVTGGMLGKVSKLMPLVQRHRSMVVHFFSGEIPGRVTEALLDGGAPFGTRLRAI